jgi:predicted DNA-binding transcriptional regulator AlpA
MTRRKLLRVVDIAELLGVSKQRADQLRREPDFPVPVDRWARGDMWAASDIRLWARTQDGGSARWGPPVPHPSRKRPRNGGK